MNFTPCISWIKQGVAKSLPEKVKLNEEELEGIIQRTTQDIEDAEDSDGEGENVSQPEPAAPVNGQDEYGFEQYDEEIEDPDAILNLNNVAVYASNARDPEITVRDSDDEADSENEDYEIHPDDNLILCGHVDGDIGMLDVYVYNEEQNYLYVHHDLLLPALPLCFEWLNHEPGEASAGNLVAVGSMASVIEVWDVDIVDCLEAAFRLGQRASKKKKRKAKGHSKAVLDMAWNKHLSHILASGSADETVLLWDLDTGEASTKLTPFTAPVQALSWHPTEGHGLLTGCCDKSVRLFDCRSDNTFLEWELPGEVERVTWNHFDPFYFLASTDTGSVHCYDARTQAQVWELKEHGKEVTGLSLSCSCPGLLVTASTDSRLIVWDIQGAAPSLVAEKPLKLGAIHCVQTSPDSPFVVCVGGDSRENNFTVWHMEESQQVRERFSGRALVKTMSPEDTMETEETSASMQGLTLTTAAEPSTSEPSEPSSSSGASASTRKKRPKKQKKLKLF